MCVCVCIKDKIIFIHSSIDRRLCFHILSIVNNAAINVLQKTYSKHWASLVAQMISVGDLGLIPGLRRSPGGGHGNPL